jgi:hypothetical protein
MNGSAIPCAVRFEPNLLTAHTKRLMDGARAMQAAPCGDRAGISG